MGIGSKYGIVAETGNNIQTLGLVAYWDAAYKKSYISGSTSTYNLASGSLTPTGSLKNDVGWEGINPTSSFIFDGSDDSIDCGANSSLQPTSGITLSTWFTIPTADLHFGTDTLISQDHTGYAGTHNGYSLDVTIASNGWLYYLFYLENGTAATQISGATNSAGSPPYVGDTWYHFLGTWDGSDMTLYINGNPLGTTSFTGPITYDSSQETWIGRRGHGQAQYFVGNIANAKIYNRALSSADVLQNFNAGKDRFGL